MNGKKAKRFVILGASGIFLIVLLFSYFFGNLRWIERFEFPVQDFVFQWPNANPELIYIFGVDEYALDTFGQWPWPRERIAEAINILNSDPDAMPAVIGIDVLFTELTYTPDGELSPGDIALIEAAQAGNVVFASSFDVRIPRDERLLTVPQIMNHLRPFYELSRYAGYGVVNGIFDDDGVVRNALFWEYFDGERVHSFPVTIAMKYLGITDPYDFPDFIQENAYMFIRYWGMPSTGLDDGDFFEGSVAYIFEDWFDPAFYADMIVLIGPYAMGMRDHYQVPIDPRHHMFGVEIHANSIFAIIDEAFKMRAPMWINIAVIIAFLLIGLIIGELVDIRIAGVIFFVLSAGYVGLTIYFYFFQYTVLYLLFPPLLLLIFFVYQLVYGYALQFMERARLRSAFKKYVDPKLVDVLIKSGDADNDGVGKKKHIAVVFVDVRGFTPMTETLRETPELIVETLNEYLELTSSSIFNNGGSVDKFIGDATMALFNGFVPLDDYVYKAVKAAWDMVQGAERVNELIKSRHGIDIGFGVGVHVGEAIVGNLGPPFRKDYTAIGDTVNTAARLESNAKRSQVLISRDVYEMLGERVTADSIGEIPLKGKSVPLEIFALTGVN